MAKLTEEQRHIIDNKVKDIKCPLCGGSIIYFVEPFQLICMQEGKYPNNLVDIATDELHDYLCGECQDCGYTILRRLDVLLKYKPISATKVSQPSDNPQDVSAL